MATPMMASHGCGQRIGPNWSRSVGLVALVASSFGGVPGPARACHIVHHAKPTASQHLGTGSTVHSAQILNPASLIPPVPPLTPTSPSTITPTSTTMAPVASITPTPLTHPPAAEQITPTSAPPAVSNWHDASPSSNACPPPPPCNPPVVAKPPAAEGLNPPSSLSPPPVANTPEPSTIVSALAMIGVAVAYRRRQARRVG